MATCKGCGKEIVWGLTGDGKKIPLDPKPPVYSFIGDGDEHSVPVIRHRGAMVTHFATCPEANRFSGSKKKGGE